MACKRSSVRLRYAPLDDQNKVEWTMSEVSSSLLEWYVTNWTSNVQHSLCFDPLLVFIGACNTPFFLFFVLKSFIEVSSSLLEFCEARSDVGPLCFDPLLVFVGACNTPFFYSSLLKILFKQNQACLNFMKRDQTSGRFVLIHCSSFSELAILTLR